MGSKIAIVLIGIALLVGGYFLLTSNSDTSPTDTGQEISKSQLASGGSNTNAEFASDSVAVAPATSDSYVNYSEAALADASENGRTLLFFSATWCPTCRAAEKDILSNSGDLPSDLTIIKTDYDSEKALKDKYNVVVQHTFVQIDSEGNEITKWSGGGVKTILQNLEEM